MTLLECGVLQVAPGRLECVDNLTNLRIRIEPDVNEALDRVIDEQKTTKQLLISSVLRWYCRQDQMVRMMIIGQMPVTADLVEHVLRQIRPAASGPIAVIEGGKVREPLTSPRRR